MKPKSSTLIASSVLLALASTHVQAIVIQSGSWDDIFRDRMSGPDIYDSHLKLDRIFTESNRGSESGESREGSFVRFAFGSDFEFGGKFGHSESGSGDPSKSSGSSVSAAPLPATLPLFATGLGALALFSWWKRRKARGIA